VVYSRRVCKGLVVPALLAACSILTPRQALADITLAEKDGWSAFMNGRVQLFFNYGNGQGFPKPAPDAYGNDVVAQGGGLEEGDIEYEEGVDQATTQGKIEELRLRTGFVGNVLGFGVRKQLNETTDITGYSAVTLYPDSTDRRKYREGRPDWRETFMRINAPWGTLTAGRTLVLFSRGATEITYLYGFKYGLGWPGSINSKGGNGPGAGHVGFGVMGNGFGAGLAYATPSLGGFQATAGIYDANSYPSSAVWTRTKWPRPEAELTYEMGIGDIGMFKLFGNGVYQKMYQGNGHNDSSVWGVGYGGRVEVGPVHLGLAGHMGQGVGLNFALEPNPAIFHIVTEEPVLQKFRDVDGYYAQLMVSPLKTFDIMAGAGITRVKLLPEDKLDVRYDNDGDDPDNDGLVDTDGDMTGDAPATPRADDDATPGNDPVMDRPIKQQVGLSGGVTFHLDDNLHLAFEYFRAMFEWYKPTHAPAGYEAPTQKLHVVNAGITYDF
jgi:hypothetical protein